MSILVKRKNQVKMRWWGQAQCLKPIILATQEAKIGSTGVLGQPKQKSSRDPILTNGWVSWHPN
jgi:hypothetical protein